MNLILEYVEIILEIDAIQVSGLNNNMKVQQNNNLANRARNIASEIDRKYPEMKITFYQLLLTKI